jgi:hypothetical protein
MKQNWFDISSELKCELLEDLSLSWLVAAATTTVI